MTQKLGHSTLLFDTPPVIKSTAAIVGKKEGEGPLSSDFDMILEDEYLGEKSWELAESQLAYKTSSLTLKKSGLKSDELSLILSGDLQNQCAASHYSMRNFKIPFLGLYGACSTMTESLAVAAMLCNAFPFENILCGTSSHFCSAEKQFRFPLEYGSIRTPTSQWTVTGAGFAIVGKNGKNVENLPKITCVTIGKIVDMGICDINNMGAAMAPAAADTLITHFEDCKKVPDDYDLILTGDLGEIGSDLLCDILNRSGYDIYSIHNDCGKMIFDPNDKDVHAGGSGCGCCASVFCSHIYKELIRGNLKKIAIMATGALMNPQILLQGESIPCIAHLVSIEMD